MAAEITNAQRAIAAFEAMSAYARAIDRPGISGFRDDAGEAGERLARLLCGLRHQADLINGLPFDDALDTSRQNYQRARGTSPAQMRLAVRAIDIHEHEIQRRSQDGSGPPAMLTDLRRYARTRGLTTRKAKADLLTAVITDLRHYADTHHVDFTTALAASHHAYTEQRLREEGPFQADHDTRRSPVLIPSSAAPPFEPIATSQGVVTSITDTERLLVRTAARIHELEGRQPGAMALLNDRSDRQALSEALAAACGLTESEILARLKPQIIARAEEIQHGTAAAAELGRRHGTAGAEPYCRLDMGGHDARLMEALGETEPTTSANALYRLSLIQAYTAAYKRAGSDPAQLAGRDYPQGPGEPFGHEDLVHPADPARPAQRTESPRRRKKP